MRKVLLLLPFVFAFLTGFAQGPDKYIVFFKDKNGTPYSLSNPSAYLSQRAVNRRQAQGIQVDSSDLPVNPSYLQQVSNTGALILGRSRWFNTVTIQTNDPSAVSTISGFSFVKNVKKVFGTGLNRQRPENIFEDARTMAPDPLYGWSYNQIAMLNGHLIHQLGYKGQGKMIAVLDAGFLNADILPAFDSLRMNGQIKGTWDFVTNDTNVYEDSGHGTNVLSLMGANVPGTLIGTAPKAEYWLLRSEDAPTEYLIEEYNWVSAAEFADSAGADVINSSLGYTEFDAASQNHTYSDMDGNTAPASIGADIAASKGILVVNSAGNSGNDPWTYIGAPADGDSVMAVGAVDSVRMYASFSSRGPSSDGQVKPNVSAQGRLPFLARTDGTYGNSSGTSFSSPIMAGMAASFWSAFPTLSNMQLMTLIQQSADRANNPDDYTGYGIPDFMKAYGTMTDTDNRKKDELKVFPNPFDSKLFLSFYAEDKEEAFFSVYNLLGQEIFTGKADVYPYLYNTVSFEMEHETSGMYIIHLNLGDKTLNSYVIKK